MNKSIVSLALAALLSLAAVPAHALFEANVDAGYTLLNPTDLNTALSKGNSAVTEVKSGFYVAADAGITIFPFLKFSPRVSAVFANQGKCTTPLTATYAIDSSIVPMELGLMTDVSIPLSGLSARAGVWGGYGFGVAAETYEIAGLKATNLYQGGAFTAEALASLRYSILPLLSINLEAGYRLAKISKLTDAAGRTWTNATGDMALDLSGVNLGGGITLSF